MLSSELKQILSMFGLWMRLIWNLLLFCRIKMNMSKRTTVRIIFSIWLSCWFGLRSVLVTCDSHSLRNVVNKHLLKVRISSGMFLSPLTFIPWFHVCRLRSGFLVKDGCSNWFCTSDDGSSLGTEWGNSIRNPARLGKIWL